MKTESTHPFLARRGSSPSLDDNQQSITIDFAVPSYLKDHCVLDMPVLPGSVYIEMIIAASAQREGGYHPVIKDIQFDRLFLLDNKDEGSLLFSIEDIIEDNQRRLSINAAQESKGQDSTQYMSCRLVSKVTAIAEEQNQTLDIETVQNKCSSSLVGADLYKLLLKNGNGYEPAFRAIEHLHKGENELLAAIEIPAEHHADWEAYHIHPVLLDACLQTVIAGNLDLGLPFLVKSIDSFQLQGSPTTKGWIHVQISGAVESEGLYTSDVTLYNESGNIVAVLRGVHIQQLHDVVEDAHSRASGQTIAVAATFTAEPIAPVLSYWMQQWEQPSDIEFAPYNQPFQQLLDPNSLLSTNKEGFNTVLLRLEDWMGNRTSLSPKVSTARKAELLVDQSTHTLPNHAQIAHLNQYESEYLYKEIFLDKAYLRHGIKINSGDCVIDVGANIGMFTLFVLNQAADAEIYSFEPSPPAFDALKTNAALYGEQVKVFQCGLSDQDGEAPFTFYRHSSVFSSYHPDAADDHRAVKTVIENALQQIGGADSTSVAELTEDMMSDRMESETFLCPIRTLSSIIDQENIRTIDLLKVDVEKSERQVLAGIEDRHWPIIKQIVLEVHDIEGEVIEEVKTMLTARGFELAIEEEDLLEKSGLYNIYGRRAQTHEEASFEKEENQTAVLNLKRNVTSFLDALSIYDQRSKVPAIVGICASSPSTDHPQDVFGEMAGRLKEDIEAMANVHLLRHNEVVERYPVADIYDADADKLGHVPFTDDYFAALGTSIVRKSQALSRKPFKVIVLDCDHTLWKGVCGEDGPMGVEVDPPRQMFQSFLLEQYKQGMLLCLCSKNAEEDVLDVFEGNKQMRLTMEHIVTHRINWEAKSENIKALASELQLGLDSFIFIDDNPVECAEVRARCPEVLVLQLPADPSEIPAFLRHQWAFDKVNLTNVDAQRTRMYKQNVEREEFRKTTLTFASFIEELNLVVHISEPTELEIPRVAQLTHRTNQFNLTTYRRHEGTLNDLFETGTLHALIVKVKDRFGDYGIVGTLLFALSEDALIVDTLLLSCRVLGKGVEYEVLQYLGNHAQTLGRAEVVIPFIPSRKNQPARAFLEKIPGNGAPEALNHEYFERNQTVSDGATEPGVQYIFKADDLKKLRFAPDEETPQAAELVETTTQAGVRENGMLATPKGQLLESIANDYRTIEQIMRAIESISKRKRSSIPGLYVAPTDELERTIASIWESILFIDRVGITDHFFELGGTSLKAVQAISRIREALDTDIAAVSLFDKATIKDIAVMVRDDDTHAPGKSDSTVRERGKKRREMRSSRRRSS